MTEIKTDSALWIWDQECSKKNDWVMFRRNFVYSKQVSEIYLDIAVDSKYFLWINGKLAVVEGGLNRGPYEGSGYADRVYIDQFLISGNNNITLLVWYWGNQGRNNIDSTKPGLLISSNMSELESNHQWLTLRHPSYQETQEPLPSYLFGGYNIGYNANYEIPEFNQLSYRDADWNQATTYGQYPVAPWHKIYLRPIPLWHFSDIIQYKSMIECNGIFTCVLPYATHLSIYFKIEAQGDEVIHIQTDRYEVHGGPGEENKTYRGHRIEYICKPGLNEFESLYAFYGENVHYTLPGSVKIIQLGYREVVYPANIKGFFKSDNVLINRLIDKCARTLVVCMRDNLMDCPDREKGQWIGDVSVQVPQIFYTLERSADQLITKSISDFIHLRKGDVLVGNVPGVDYIELPSQSLNAVSELGMIAQYYNYTKDISVLALCYEPVYKYLKLWSIQSDDLILSRKGGWAWFDHLYNVDDVVLENAWYFSALKFLKYMSEVLNRSDHKFFIENAMSRIYKGFQRLWNGKYYSSGVVADERANALAILSGLTPEEHYPTIMHLIVNSYNASPYMENYILDALCIMGYKKEAHERAALRYRSLEENDNSTLWENFTTLGTKNHAWSGGPLTMYYKHFAGIGINSNDEFFLKPDINVLKEMHVQVPTKKGQLEFKISRRDLIILEINVEFDGLLLILNAKNLGLIDRMSLNDKEVTDGHCKYYLDKGKHRFEIK